MAATVSMTPQVAVPDPTLADPVQKAQIQQYYGVSLDRADKQVVAFIVDSSKRAGNQAFREGRHAGIELT